MIKRKYFGTDGMRGEFGITPITPDFFLKLGWAAGKIFCYHKSKKIIVGKDTRVSCSILESALEAGLAAAGLSVFFTGPLPTPAIAYLTRAFQAAAGIVISASHNKFNDNGIKLFTSLGTKVADNIEEAIERKMTNPFTCVTSSQLGKTQHILDAAGRYIEYCKGTFPRELNLNNLKIVVDCANGSTYHIAPKVLIELGATVIPISTSPNGININQDCGTSNLEVLKKKVVDETADVGLAYDGDGDRVMMVDHLGNKVDGDQMLFIIAREQFRQGKLKGGVIGTVMSNLGLELSLKKMSIPFVRTKIGNRSILEKMLKQEWYLGGENGHIILLDKTTTGDGIIAGLQVLMVMIRNHMSLHELCNGIKMMPQVLININLTGNSNPLNSPLVHSVTAAAEKELAGRGYVLVRNSGTEPVIRVMVTSENEEQASLLANRIADVIKGV